MESVPAQKDALQYLENASASLKCSLIVGGHSKGGNLAIYAASFSSPKTKKRLIAVYNNDGPGFKEEFFLSDEYKSIKNIEHTYVPELSIVGMLFSHADGYITVESDAKGINQHDGLSWHTNALHFEEQADTNDQSKFIGKTINEWINNLTIEERELFIETVFGILKQTNATTNSELNINKFDTMLKMLKATSQLDSKTRDAAFKTVQLLLKYAKDNVGGLLPHK